MSAQLSPHFNVREFLTSQTAARMGRVIEAPDPIVRNMSRLCVLLLEPIRVKLGRPIVVSSGYRPEWLNTTIGGSKTSAHMHGSAADVEVVGMSPTAFCRWIEANWRAEAWPIDQCILEFPPNGWTHLGIAEKPRGEFLTAKSMNGRTVYYRGIDP